MPAEKIGKYELVERLTDATSLLSHLRRA